MRIRWDPTSERRASPPPQSPGQNSKAALGTAGIGDRVRADRRADLAPPPKNLSRGLTTDDSDRRIVAGTGALRALLVTRSDSTSRSSDVPRPTRSSSVRRSCVAGLSLRLTRQLRSRAAFSLSPSAMPRATIDGLARCFSGSRLRAGGALPGWSPSMRPRSRTGRRSRCGRTGSATREGRGWGRPCDR